MTQTVSQALARKWRPRDFDSLVGQAHVVKALSHALDNQRLHHAYLFTGTRGVGKTTLARILARAVNCEEGISRSPCGKCNACIEIGQGRFVDLLEVDAATNTRVDEMRALLENAMYAPTAGRYKVYVIDEVHMLSTSAFNAMLKTLEEPPGHVLFILATTDPQKIPATVLSRCLQFALRQLPPDLLVDHLAHILTQEQIVFERPALSLLAKAACGSVRDALSLTDQAIAYSAACLTEETVRNMLGTVDQQVVLQILQALARGEGKTLIEISGALAAVSAPFGAILDELAVVAYRLSVAHFTEGMEADNATPVLLESLRDLFGAEDLQLIYQIATHARAELHLAPEQSIGFSMALMRMLAFKPGGQAATLCVANPSAPPVVPTPAESPNNLPQAMPFKTKVETVVSNTQSVQRVQEISPLLPGPSFNVVQVFQDSLPNSSNWPHVSQQVRATGLTRQALVQAELVDAQRDGDVLHIVLKTAIKSYTEPSMVARMETALAQYYVCTVRLQMQLGQAQQTAHAIQSQTRRQAIEEAKQTLQQDPFLKEIQVSMGATLVAGSERTLSNTGPIDI